ncbi:hypothetical protein V5799_000476 [Amblyomma americanum]|uniref:Uncharacterized protein n=1 Tax=Amblyomma americanum TaxID=6943 RepID=A0AAQ4D2Y9_AMBAM
MLHPAYRRDSLESLPQLEDRYRRSQRKKDALILRSRVLRTVSSTRSLPARTATATIRHPHNQHAHHGGITLQDVLRFYVER